MASVTSAAELSAPLRRCFTHEIIMELPNRSERECILRSHLEDPFRDSSATLANSQPASALLDFRYEPPAEVRRSTLVASSSDLALYP